MSEEIKIERTGNIFSFAGSEFKVIYPDGYVGTIWSPPWHEMDKEEEDREAKEYAKSLWEKKEHKEVS